LLSRLSIAEQVSSADEFQACGMNDLISGRRYSCAKDALLATIFLFVIIDQ